MGVCLDNSFVAMRGVSPFIVSSPFSRSTSEKEVPPNAEPDDGLRNNEP